MRSKMSETKILILSLLIACDLLRWEQENLMAVAESLLAWARHQKLLTSPHDRLPAAIALPKRRKSWQISSASLISSVTAMLRHLATSMLLPSIA